MLSPETELVVFIAWDTPGDAGTSNVISKKQLPPAGKDPPANSMVPGFGLALAIPPQTETGNPVACKPDRAAFKSSVNVILVIGFVISRFSSVNLKATVPPGATGSSINYLVNWMSSELTTSTSVAGKAVPISVDKLDEIF